MKKFWTLLAFTVIGLMLPALVYAKTIVTDGLVSYWTFDRNTIKDKTVEDVWGENDATLVGNPKITVGYLFQGIELNGIADYVSLPNVSNFGSRLGAYTFEAWLKTSHHESWSAIYMVSEPPCGRHRSGHGILINTAWPDNFDRIFVTKKDHILIQRSTKIGEGGCAGGSSIREKPVSDGKWHHVVYTTREPTEEEKERLRFDNGTCSTNNAYIDTESFWGSISCTTGENRPYTEPIFLGAVNNNGKAEGFFQGIFDEIRIYDRALTHEEIIRNYESGIGLSVDGTQKLSTVWGELKMIR